MISFTCYIAYSLITIINAVPLSMVMNSPGIGNLNAIDEIGNEDFTTHTLERLSSAATCLVAGIEYTHGQQIYRKDQCEFCLCLDGEMFCWWQDCPPAVEGPCKDRGPFSPCRNGVNAKISNNKIKQATKPTSEMSSSSTATTKTEMLEADITLSTDYVDESSTEIIFLTSQKDKDKDKDKDKEEEDITSTSPKSCDVMGRKYNVGDRLPHDTGNCLECICGVGAQITCSPHQCGPPTDDINDYRPPGVRSAQPDVFK